MENMISWIFFEKYKFPIEKVCYDINIILIT